MYTITVLNTPILTKFGKYQYNEISLDRAREIAQQASGFNQLVSAVGHQSTCDILTTLLNTPIPMNRIEYKQEVGTAALIFKLKGRPEEGKILTVEEIEEIGYNFGLLIRLE